MRHLLVLLCFCLLPITALAETRLLMAEQPGCYWCERWDEEIAAIYPKTDEGRAAPLLRYNLHNGLPEGVEVQTRVQFTPTFILVQNGREIGRIEGYPGEDFFWGLLDQLLKRSGVNPAQSG